MSYEGAQTLRRAIEDLINVKLLDAVVRPGGADRLLANRVSGVASKEVREAEMRLEQAILACTIDVADDAPRFVAPRRALEKSNVSTDSRRRAEQFVDPT